MRRLVLNRTLEELRCTFDQPPGVLEQPIAIASSEFNLMLTTFRGECSDILDRMRAGHFGRKFREQLHLSKRAVEGFGAGKDHLFEQHSLGTQHKMKRPLVRMDNTTY